MCMLTWKPLQPRYPHQVLRAVESDLEFWVYSPSGQDQRWRLLQFAGNTYRGTDEYGSLEVAQHVAECVAAGGTR